VVKGDGRGAQLGFPTANIRPPAGRTLVPADGVYCVSVGLAGEKLKGMLNIGVRPTFRTSGQRTIEVHLFDWNDTIEDRTVRVHFLKRLRGEKKFSSAEELIRQLESDRDACLKHIAAHQLQTS
jgi:riboflavin kinase / FMN adenylyltransferase